MIAEKASIIKFIETAIKTIALTETIVKTDDGELKFPCWRITVFDEDLSPIDRYLYLCRVLQLDYFFDDGDVNKAETKLEKLVTALGLDMGCTGFVDVDIYNYPNSPSEIKKNGRLKFQSGNWKKRQIDAKTWHYYTTLELHYQK